MTTPTPAETRRRTGRFLAPDLARGAMLAPIALANVMLYLHARPYGLRQHIVTDGVWDRGVTALTTALVDARAYPLFAALFGYGLVQMVRRRRGAGMGDDEIGRASRRRSWALICFGAVHALLAFSGDILGWYGLLGLATTRLLRLGDRALLRFAVVWLVVASAVQGLVYADPTVRTERTFFASFAIDDAVGAAAWRMVEWVMTPFGLLAVVSALLVGAWAARHRILERPERHVPLLRRTAVVGIGASVLGGLGTALATAGLWVPSSPVAFLLSWLHILTGVLGGLGYAAVIALVVVRLERRGRTDGAVVRALRATGERSLSAYLAQSAVFAALLPAATLGWGARFGPVGAALLALATWVATVLGSWALSHAGRRGPAEALLRRLTRTAPAGVARATIEE